MKKDDRQYKIRYEKETNGIAPCENCYSAVATAQFKTNRNIPPEIFLCEICAQTHLSRAALDPRTDVSTNDLAAGLAWCVNRLEAIVATEASHRLTDANERAYQWEQTATNLLRRAERAEKINRDLAAILWRQLGDIPWDTESEKEEIEVPFLHFTVGTPRAEIWQWFEESTGLSVAKDLMHL